MKSGLNRVKQQGVTLVELVISIVIMSIAMVAMMNSFSVSMSHSADPLWRNKTLKLAQLYLDEILSKAYDENTPLGGIPALTTPSCASLGPDGTEARADYDDVDDYHGISNQTPVSLVGSLDSSYDDYSVSVTVECDTAGNVSASGNNHAKKITVEVTPPNSSTMTFAAYKGNY